MNEMTTGATPTTTTTIPAGPRLMSCEGCGDRVMVFDLSKPAYCGDGECVSTDERCADCGEWLEDHCRECGECGCDELCSDEDDTEGYGYGS